MIAPIGEEHAFLAVEISKMNSISAIMHKAKFARGEYPVLAIDGIPVYEWIVRQMSYALGEVDTSGLVPAQGWLIDEDHASVAWELLEPVAGSSTVVPLLICADDQDLSCTVVAVEQVVDDKNVAWKRFGLSLGHINGVVTSVRWDRSGQCATFDRMQFEVSVQELRRLIAEM